MSNVSETFRPGSSRLAAIIPGLERPDLIALWLRIGLGSVFLIGGINKLGKLLDPTTEAALVASYMSPHG